MKTKLYLSFLPKQLADSGICNYRYLLLPESFSFIMHLKGQRLNLSCFRPGVPLQVFSQDGKNVNLLHFPDSREIPSRSAQS